MCWYWLYTAINCTSLLNILAFGTPAHHKSSTSSTNKNGTNKDSTGAHDELESVGRVWRKRSLLPLHCIITTYYNVNICQKDISSLVSKCWVSDQRTQRTVDVQSRDNHPIALQSGGCSALGLVQINSLPCIANILAGSYSSANFY